jgi:hypothetical protein
MAARTITVTLPNGETAKRKTERNYSHAVCFSHKVLSFCGSYELAQKRINSVHPEVQERLTIVPVNA